VRGSSFIRVLSDEAPFPRSIDRVVSTSAVAEAYPDLLAAETFRGLQEQLATTEDRIAYARAY